MKWFNAGYKISGYVGRQEEGKSFYSLKLDTENMDRRGQRGTAGGGGSSTDGKRRTA
jgi:hypothetical protein